MPYDEFDRTRAARNARVDAALKALRGEGLKPFEGVPEPPPAEEPELSMAARYLPLAVRGVGGFIGSAPGVGALGGLGSEVVAEGLENYFGTREGLSPWEIASATALGAAGGGMVKAIGSAPTALTAAARSGAIGATMPFIRSGLEEGELPEASDVALSTLLSAGTGGALGHFLGKTKAAQKAATDSTVELFGSKGAGTIERTIKGSGAPPAAGVATDVEAGAGRGYSRAGYAETPEHLEQLPKNKRAARQEASDARRERMDAERISKAEAKLAQEAEAARQIEEAKAQGLVPQDSVSETMSAPTAAGTERLTRRFVQPAEEEGAEAAADLLGGGAAVQSEASFIDALSGKGAAAKSAKRVKGAAKAPAAVPVVQKVLGVNEPFDPVAVARHGQDVIGTPTPEQILSTPNAIPVNPEDLVNTFGPGAAFSTAPNSPEDLLGALRGLAAKKGGALPAVPQRGQAAQIIDELPADITQRPGYTPGPPAKGGGGQLAKMTEQEAAPDRFAQYLKATGREELDLAAERAKNPGAFGTQPIDALTPGGVSDDGMTARIFQRAADWDAERAAQAAAPTGAETTIPMSQVGRGQLPVASQHYNALQNLFKSGTSGVPQEAAKLGARTSGRALQRIGREAEAGTLPAAPIAPQAAPKAPTAPQVTPEAAGRGLFGKNAPESLRRFLSEASSPLNRRPGAPGAMGPSRGGGSGFGRMGGEGGFVDPSLLIHGGAATAGALTGSIVNEDDPFVGALEGAAAGAALSAAAFKIAPHIQSIMSSPTLDDITKQSLSLLGTPEGMKQAATEIINRIPTTLRANLLWSSNLPNNAIVGPYGAAIAAATERHLAGDPRAAELLKMLTPSNWGRAFMESLEEASKHLGEAERGGGHLLGAAKNPYDVYTSLPGTWMHAGDLASRKLGILAGFSEEEMKAFTMTAEPEFGITKWMANLPRTGLPGQLLAPFMRTAANAIEQGSFRTPILGLGVQALRENPDAMNVQAVQQLLGAGAMGGGYIAGQYEDELTDNPLVSPSMLRAFTRNVVGPYSVLASSGYATGKAMDQGKSGYDSAFTGAGAYLNETPLPTLNVLRDYLGFARDPGVDTLPAGIAPKGLIDYLNPEKTKGRPQRPKANRPKRPGE